MKLSDTIVIKSNLLETWKNCGGYYECPKDASNRRFGPLVAYTGKYQTPEGESKNFVGDVYYDFARVEEHPMVLDHFACILSQEIRHYVGIADVMLGAPLGGMYLALATARAFNCRVIFAEKARLDAVPAGKKEETKIIFGRHRVRFGERVVIVEDVCNNFSTTTQLTQLVLNFGGQPVAIACALNRSGKPVFSPYPGCSIPVLTTLFIPTQQFKQEDPEVAAEVQNGNVCWNPKIEWDNLLAMMAENFR